MRRRALGSLVAMAVLGMIGCSALGEGRAQAIICFRNVNVIDISTGSIRPGQTVLIGGDHIVAVGPDTAIDTPEGARTIDGRGGYLCPGLIDMHTHLGSSNDVGYLFLRYGVTTIRSLDGAPQHVAMRRMIAAGDLIGPTIFTSGPILYGSEPEWTEEANVSAAARRIVASHVAIGYDFLKVYYQLTRDQYRALLAAADEAHLPVVGHVPWSVGLDGVFASNQRTNEHLTGYDEFLQDPESDSSEGHTAWKEVLRYQSVDEARIQQAARMSAKSGIWEVPTLVDWEKWTHPQKINELLGDESRMGLLSAETRESWSKYNKWQIPPLESWSAEDHAMMESLVSKRRAIVNALHQAGARLAIGTDSIGARFVYPGLSVHEELEAFVASGLSEVDALRAATLNAALAMDCEGEFGEIKVGQRADLVLLEENPLEDIHATQDIAGVMVRGRWFTRESLEQLVAHLRKD